MEINFNLYYQKHIGTIAKDNETILNGIEATCDIDLSNVNYMYANYCIGGTYKKDTNVNIDLAKNTIQIPIKTDYLKKGNNQFEIVAIMKNGDIKTSQTYDYYISKSLENEEALEGDNNYPILIQLIESIKVVEQNEEIRKQNEIQRESTFNQKIYLLDNNEVDRNVRFENKLNEVDSNISSKILEFDKNEINRNKRIDSKLIEINDTVLGKVSELDSNENIRKSNEVARQSNEVSRNNEFNNIKTQFSDLKNNVEVIGARKDTKGVTHNSLDTRIDKEVEYINNRLNVVNVDVEGSYITVTDSVEGSINNTEVLGNTVQNPSNLADIKSVGIKKEDGTYEMSILSCGKNKFNPDMISNFGTYINGVWDTDKMAVDTKIPIKCKANDILSYVLSRSNVNGSGTFRFIHTDGTESLLALNGTVGQKYTHKFTKDVSSWSYIKWGSSVALYDIQLEEGTVATPYEPYKSTKSTISLPCKLGKGDRLYWDKDEKAWCVSKGQGIKVLEDKDIIEYRTSTVNTDNIVFMKPFDSLGYGETSSSTLDSYWLEGYSHLKGGYDKLECVGKLTIMSIDRFVLGLAKGTYTNLTEAKKLLLGKKMYYIRKTPQKIILPLSTQIALNSFFGTTHISLECGDVEGTIKATVPKSVSASVQSLQVKTDILSDRVEAIEGLKDSQNMRYETDKGYLVAEATQNGVVEDIKVSGKTLVNLYRSDLKSRLGINGKVTVVNFNSNNIDILLFENGVHSSNLVLNSNDKVFVYTLTPTQQLFIRENTTNLKAKVVVLEGDHTQNPPSYFEGIKSVGQDVSEIEVLSSNEDFRFSYEEGAISTGNGSNVPNDTAFRTSFIKCHSNINYELNYNCFIFLYDSSKKFIKSVNGADPLLANTPFNSENASYIRFYKGKTDFEKVQITSKTYQSHKKSILYYNELGELVPVPQLREWDSVEEKNDKTLYTVGSGEVVLNGSENWQHNTPQPTNTNLVCYYLPITNAIGKDGKVICDKLQWTRNYNEIEGVKFAGGYNSLLIIIDKSKLETQDVTGFKKWLQANPVTVVYQLAIPKVYECPNLNLSSYSNETMISLNSGAINPRMEFSITSHINELVKNNQARINELESYVHKVATTILSEGYQGLAYLLYPNDFVEENEIELLPVEPI